MIKNVCGWERLAQQSAVNNLRLANRSSDRSSGGGLGIFPVKKTMDDMAYARRDGHIVPTIRKRL